MEDQVILMIALRPIKPFQRAELGDDGRREGARLLQLRDISRGDALLFGIGDRKSRSGTACPVGVLIVQRCRIHHREIDAQDPAVGDDPRIEDDLHGLRVAGSAGADHLVMRRGGVAARIAGQHLLDALHMLEDALHAPETAARQHRGFRCPGRVGIAVDGGSGQGARGFVGAGRAGAQNQQRGNGACNSVHRLLPQAGARGTNLSDAEFMQ